MPLVENANSILAQSKFDDLSASGREILVNHKLTERSTFEKIGRSSVASIELQEPDYQIVVRWWDEVHVQKKSNPFSIASILAKPESSTSTPKKTPVVEPPPQRRQSVLDDIIFLQKTLQKSVLGGVAKTPGGAVMTPNPLTPGKAFPKTPGTPTVKDYRSDFEKRVLKNNFLTDHLTPDAPITPPVKITKPSQLVYDPLPPTSFLSQPNLSGPITVTAPSVAKNISLLDLPMPNLVPQPASTTSKIKIKKRKKDYLSSAYQDLDSAGDSNYRKFLASRSPLPITRLPSICKERAKEHAESDIRTVDNYR